MNVLDLYVKTYSRLYTQRSSFSHLFSPVRWGVRKLANYHIPHYLSHCRQPERHPVCDELIVSLTSFPPRIDNVWQVVECMLRQTVLPSKVFLWLSKEQFPSMDSIPLSLRERQNDIFKIRLVDEDLRSHKKYYYVFNENPDKMIVLIDDDLYYPGDMLESLVNEYKRTPNSVICRYGYVMEYGKDNELKEYSSWKSTLGACSSNHFFFGSGGGTLIVPSFLYKDYNNRNLFEKLTPLADDIWLNAMVKLAGLKIIKLDSGLLCPIFNKNSTPLSRLNVLENQNDKQIKSISEYYKERGLNPFGKNLRRYK